MSIQFEIFIFVWLIMMMFAVHSAFGLSSSSSFSLLEFFRLIHRLAWPYLGLQIWSHLNDPHLCPRLVFLVFLASSLPVLDVAHTRSRRHLPTSPPFRTKNSRHPQFTEAESPRWRWMDARAEVNVPNTWFNTVNAILFAVHSRLARPSPSLSSSSVVGRSVSSCPNITQTCHSFAQAEPCRFRAVGRQSSPVVVRPIQRPVPESSALLKIVCVTQPISSIAPVSDHFRQHR